MSARRGAGPGGGVPPAAVPGPESWEPGDRTWPDGVLAALQEGPDPLLLLERAGPGGALGWPGTAWRVAFANHALAGMVRRPPGTLTGLLLDDLFGALGNSLRALVPGAAGLVARGQPFRMDLPLRADEIRWLEAQLTPVRLGTGAGGPVTGPVTHWLVVMRDVTAHRQALSLASGHTRAMRLAAQDAPLTAILETLIATLDERLPGSAASAALWEDGHLRVVAPPRLFPGAPELRLTRGEFRALSCGRAVLEGRPVLSLTPAGFPAALRADLLGAGYRRAYSVPVQEAGGPVLGSLTLFGRRAARPYRAETELLRQFADLAALLISRGQAQRRLEYLAFHDPLTGLANRARYMAALEEACARLTGPEAGPGADFAVGMLDLDGFKLVNDAHGHAAGDEVLVSLAARLTAALPGDVLLARMGGDEFALLVPGPTEARMEGVRQVVREAFRSPLPFGASQAQLGASLGWAVAPHEARTPDALLRRADDAMYAAKREGGRVLQGSPAERAAVDWAGPDPLSEVGQG